MPLLEPEAHAMLAVQRLLALGALTADSGDGDGYAALFTVDGVIEGLPRGPIEGREAIREYYNRGVADPPRRHHVSSIHARFDADGILRATSYFLIVGAEPVFGVYDHEFAAQDEGWLIRRKITRIESRRTP